jgi:hypothetical protein
MGHPPGGGDEGIFIRGHGFCNAEKTSFGKLEVLLMLSAMDLGMSFGCAAGLEVDSRGVSDFPPQLTRGHTR